MDVNNYTFVAANNSQTATIKSVVFSVLREYGLQPGTIDSCLDNVEQHYFGNGGYFGVLLDENNHIVATGGLYKLNDRRAEIRKMYLLSEHRGKGLGKMILHALIEKAKFLGFESIELETASVLKEAIGLYQKLGFKPYKSPHIAARCDQAYELILE